MIKEDTKRIEANEDILSIIFKSTAFNNNETFCENKYVFIESDLNLCFLIWLNYSVVFLSFFLIL